jgi:regulator of RNase E activity RraA
MGIIRRFYQARSSYSRLFLPGPSLSFANLPHTHDFARRMATSKLSQEQRQALEKYTACDIADALLKLKVPNAGFLSDMKLMAPSSADIKKEITIAPASTVVMASKSGEGTDLLPEANVPADKHWVDLTEPETIVVITQPEGQKCAVLGGIMALRMKVLNAQGVVVSGRVRDVIELASTSLPVSQHDHTSSSFTSTIPFTSILPLSTSRSRD